MSVTKLLYFTSGHRDASVAKLAEAAAGMADIVPIDLYAMDEAELHEHAAILVSMHVDQRHLAGRAERLDAYLRDGGTVVANGHHAYPFLRDLASFQPIPNARLRDLAIRRVSDHPVWDGVAVKELTFRKGVAGFYGRGWHEAPPGATVIHAIGGGRRPVDLLYPVGAGRVLFHGGNDLWQYAGAGDTTARIVPQLLAWLVAGARVP